MTVGELVVRSNKGWPLDMPASNPLSPFTTASNSLGPGSVVKTTSVVSATALGESAHSAPAAQIFSAAWRRASCTTISYAVFCLKKKNIERNSWFSLDTTYFLASSCDCHYSLLASYV